MPYINTIDINGTTYNLENLTDGNYVVDLPELNKNDIFLLRGDVVDNLSSYQQNKPISANQGRILDTKNTDLNNRVNNLKDQLEDKDSELDGKITQLRTDMESSDTSVLSTSKTYTDDKASEVLVASNEYTDNKSAETLASATQYTDDSSNTINETITALQNVVSSNKTTSDSNKSELEQKITDLKTYSNDTFIAKTSIADNLTTDSNEQVLSAKQGKELEDKKFNNTGGTISGDVTINGTLTMSDNTKGISITKDPTADTDVVNKKYVDTECSKLNSAIGTLETSVGTQITAIQQNQNDQATTLTNLQDELTAVKENTKYKIQKVLTNFDGTAVTSSFELENNCVIWVCITPISPTRTNAINSFSYNKMVCIPTDITEDFYYCLSDNIGTDSTEVQLILTHSAETNINILQVSITASATVGEQWFNICVVHHPM